MKPLRVALLALTGMLAGIMVQAQTVDEIINKHIEAIGGKEKINAIKTVYTEYTMDIQGNQASGLTYLVNGKGYRNEVDFGGQKIIQCINETGGWQVNPLMGQTSAEPLPEDQAKASKAQLFIGGPLQDYAAKGYKVEMQDKEEGAYKLQLTTPEGATMTFYIDPTTYYINKMVSKVTAGGQEMETIAVYSDYQKADNGFVSAKSTELTVSQGFVLNVTVTKLEFNKDIDVKLFEMQ
jgi:outer membrane lipoprotein-sorting protein